MSFCLWISLVSTSLLILWPELALDNEPLEQALWLVEIFWVSDMVRNFFMPKKLKAKMDLFDIAIAYLKSNFFLDLLVTLPQVASGLD